MFRTLTIDGLTVRIYADEKSLAAGAAEYILSVIHAKSNARISFATGNTMVPVYESLVEQVRETHTPVDQIQAFHLDEYYPCSPEAPFSFVKYLKDRLVQPLQLSEHQFHFVNGEAANADEEAHRYDQLLTEVDLSILGIGPGCHIGFNEAGEAFHTRTRLVPLAQETITRDHAERGQSSPTQAITQGVGTIVEAKKIMLIAFGEKKAEIMRQTLQEPIQESCPASILRQHPEKSIVFLDEAAAAKLVESRK